MAGKWIETSIGEQATLQRGLDITKTEQRAGNIPVISSGGVSSYHDTAAVSGPGVVLGRKGVVGSVYFVASDYWPHDTTLWVKDFHGNDPRFVYYFFRWFAPRLASMDVGSANPTLNRNHVHPLRVSWPPLDEQRAIAHVLGTLDDKIELNRRMNETLEAMARALFKSWFVDFDPVRAKAEGRDPGLPKGLADLLPSKITNVDTGEIPEGWSLKSLDQIARFLNGLALQKYPATGSHDLPVIKIAQLRAGNTIGSDHASAAVPAEYVVEDGDILFSWSGSLECVLWAGGPGALNQHLFKVTSSSYPRWLCYLGIHHHLEHFRHVAAGKATTMGHIQRHHLSEAMLPIPQGGLLNAMDSIMKPMVESLWRRSVQSRTLAELRDMLLPKLISGQLRVSDAERAAEQVA